MIKNCIFCNKKIVKELTLDETENFYLNVNKNPCSIGNIMIISKKHFSCFGEMPSYMDKEFLLFLEKAKKVVKENFSEPIVSEQGIHGQSVNHAHIHIFPSISETYDFSKKKLIDFIPKEIKITKERGLQDIKRTFKKEGQYVSIEENGNLYICHTRDYNGILKPGRQIISKVSGLDFISDWKNMSALEKKQSEMWVEETIKKLKK